MNPASNPGFPSQLSAVLAGNIDGRSKNVVYRQKQMHRLHACIAEHLAEIQTTIAKDYGHSTTEIHAEVGLAIQEINAHYASLDQKHDQENEYLTAHGRDNWHGTRGVGIVYIIPTMHTLFYSVISALSASIAAGNCTILELPPTTSQMSSLLRKILTDALDCDTFVICTEHVSTEYLRNMHVVAQASTDGLAVDGMHVASSYDQRTVATVDRIADVEAAAADLVISRFAFEGQSPYAPDVVLVNEFCLGRFIEAGVKYAGKYMRTISCAPTDSMSPSHRKSHTILDDLTPDDAAHVIVSGDDWGIVQVRNRKSALFQRKIEGKYLLVHVVSSLDDAINFTNLNGPHNATYTFASLPAAKYVSESIDSQIAWVNHVPYHMLVGPSLPKNSPVSPSSRYPTGLFRVSHAKIVNPTSGSALAKNLLLSTGESGVDSLQKLLSPLPAVEQRPGHKIGFFEQGLLSGGAVVLSVITGVFVAGVWMWRMR